MYGEALDMMPFADHDFGCLGEVESASVSRSTFAAMADMASYFTRLGGGGSAN